MKGRSVVLSAMKQLSFPLQMCLLGPCRSFMGDCIVWGPGPRATFVPALHAGVRLAKSRLQKLAFEMQL